MNGYRSPRFASTVALCLAAAVVGCSSPDDALPEVGSLSLALGASKTSSGAHHAGKGAHRSNAKHRHRRGHRHSHGDRTPDDPIVFTPASAAARSGRLAGVAVSSGPLLSDATYAEMVAAHFSDITPENETKWGSLQPDGPGTWDFSQADVLTEFAHDTALRVKGHTLVWHSQMPGFIDDETTVRQLDRYSRRHIQRTVRHFRDDVFAWDVVNEAIADDGSGLRSTQFSEAFGETYIDRAFRRAHRLDRRAELFYNDYGIAGINAKSDAVYALVSRLRQRHVPIDGVGFQGHFDARFAPGFDELVENFQRFADLGLSVNVSELDVRVANLGGSQAYKLAVQKQVYQRVAAACTAVEACSGITTWGFTDAYSWIDSTFGADDPLLFDEQYGKKPAYFGYVDGFVGVRMDDPFLSPNLIGNSSLEAGLDGWSVMGAGELSTVVDQSATGLRSAVVSGRQATWQGPRHEIGSLVSPSRTYDVSVSVRIAGASTAPTGVTAQVTCDGEDSVFMPIASGDATDEGWLTLVGELSVPGCDLSGVAVYVEGAPAEVDILVDDLALRERPLPNLVNNPGFETDLSGWFGFGAPLALTPDAFSGSQAAIATSRTDTWNGIATDLSAVVQANASYRVSAQMKVAGATSDTVGLTAALTCAGAGTQYLPVGSATASDAGWVEVSGSVAIGNCTVESLLLYGEGPAAGVDLLMDDVTFSLLEQGEAPSVIANSDFESGTGGWFGFGSVTVTASTELSHGGAQSAQVSGRTATWNGLATDLMGQVSEGASYSASAWVRLGSGSSNVNLTFQNSCDGGATDYSWVASATASDSEWVEMTGTLAVPECALTTGILYFEGAPEGVDLFVDDVVLTPQP